MTRHLMLLASAGMCFAPDAATTAPAAPAIPPALMKRIDAHKAEGEAISAEMEKAGLTAKLVRRARKKATKAAEAAAKAKADAEAAKAAAKTA
jgi:hypothetical protein